MKPKEDRPQSLSYDLLQALKEYISRKERKSIPSGYYNYAGCWKADICEVEPCCVHFQNENNLRRMNWYRHCCTLKHIANLHNVSYRKLLVLNRLRKTNPTWFLVNE